MMTRIEVLINVILARAYPRYIGTNEVLGFIQSHDVSCTVRTVQRHLKTMSRHRFVEMVGESPSSYRYSQEIGISIQGNKHA